MGDYVLVQSKCRKFEVSFCFLYKIKETCLNDNKIFFSSRFINDAKIYEDDECIFQELKVKTLHSENLTFSCSI